MTDRSEPFAQDPIEDQDWDRAVLGDWFDAYADVLGATQVDPDRVWDIVSRIGEGAPISPLAQALLANAMGDAILLGDRASGGSSTHSLSERSRQARGRGSASNDARVLAAVSKAAPVLRAALARYAGEPQLALPWIAGTPGPAWAPLGSLYLTKLTAQFDDGVSTLLHFAGAAGRLTPLRRQRLNGLLFHPLQNADQHGRRADNLTSFAGVAARIVGRCNPAPPSFLAYHSSLERRSSRRRDAFLEVVVHDNGVGIARHFYEAKRRPGNAELRALPLFHEWQTLYNAFERHQTSKPVSFRRATSQPAASPGVGLAGLLSALKQLQAYLELRTGRLRVFQWYDDDDVIADRALLQPAGLPAEAPLVPGTIFRMVVPLEAGETGA